MKLEDGIGEKLIQFIHVIATCLGCFVLAFTMGWQLSMVCLFSLLATFVIFGIVTMVSIYKPSPCNILVRGFRYTPFMDLFLKFQLE
jgi:ABC-type multidrug transport system fused ATPase/permease subunit